MDYEEALEQGIVRPYRGDILLRRQYHNLSQECLELREETKALQEELQRERSSRANVKQLRNAEEDVVLLKAQLEAEAEKNKNLATLNTKLLKHTGGLAFKVSQYELQIDVLTTELDALHAARNMLVAKVMVLEEKLDEKKKTTK
jgi:chromosome segregation ATPase